MKWFTHKAVAFSGALAVGASPLDLLAVLLGSILPDAADTALACGNQKRWRRIHRQTTHWFGWYLLIILLGLALPLEELTRNALHAAHTPRWLLNPLAALAPSGNDILIWLGLGGLSHVLLDALTPMRVPIFPFGGSHRFGLPLVSTGTWKEHVFLLLALGTILVQYRHATSLWEQIKALVF